MPNIEIDPRLVEQTIRDLRLVHEHLQQQRQEMDARITELSQRIHAWEVQLGRSSQRNKERPLVRRRKKGQNLKAIADLFQSLPRRSGLKMTEIADKVGLPWSSTRNVLKNNQQLFKEDTDGLWYFSDHCQDAE